MKEIDDKQNTDDVKPIDFFMELLEKFNRITGNFLVFIAGLSLVGMIALTCSNIVLRTVWLPIRGTFELMGYFGAVVAAFALGFTQMKKGHIAVDVLVNTFPSKVKIGLAILNNFICLIFFTIASWQLSKTALTLMNTGEVTETLRIVYYPFTFAVAAGCVFLSFVFVEDTLKKIFLKDNN